jgi:uncharacterized DUF497 family protein
MGSEPISESSFTAVVNAPKEKVDLADWLFGLSDAEYQRCSPAHIAAGTTRSEDGKRMSINVEMIGGSIVVQHYVEDIAEKHHIRLISLSDTFSPNGHTKVQVIWELSVKPIDGKSCEFTNHVHGNATEEFHVFLDKHGLPFESAKQARQQASEAHNRIETPLFAKSIERHALNLIPYATIRVSKR